MNKKLLFAGVILMSLLLSSCSQDDVFSCNPEINDWAKSNKEEIRKMTRSEFLELPDAGYQRAAYAVLAPEKKIDLWKTKINETLLLNWKDAEKTHIRELLTMIDENPGWFASRKEKSQAEKDAISDDIILKAAPWIEYAKEVLKWDNKQIYAIAGTPDRMLTNKGDIPEPSRARMRKARSEGPCECYDGRGDFCWTQFAGKGCTYGNCDENIEAYCGWLWGEQCNGMCTEY